MNEKVGHNNLSKLNISNLFHGKHLLIHVLSTKINLAFLPVRVFKFSQIPEPPGQFKTKFAHTCIAAFMGEAK